MEARIKFETHPLQHKITFIIITKNGRVGPRFNTKQEAREWATTNGYQLRYSG
jgi:hypothetical protein